jgi:hypothetical protein
LTADDFEPAWLVAPVERSDAGQAPTAVASPLEPSPSLGADPAECAGPSEIAGCTATLAPPAPEPVAAGRGSSELAVVTCTDGVLNGSELGVDCGGGSCPGCAVGSRCNEGADCSTLVCTGERCAPARCDDLIKNQDEADVDCGGSCDQSCSAGLGCASDDDCVSRLCGANCPPGLARCCQAPSCSDGVRNGSEPVIDCGDATCGPCALGRACEGDDQCASSFCLAGVCRVHPCQNGALDALESDIDCGGSDAGCRRCAVGERCGADADCDGLPCLGGVCSACADGRRDGSESDVDCGGACGQCAPGSNCNVDGDCQSGVCAEGRCCGGVLVDCTRCARRLVQGLSCELSTDPTTIANCNGFLDCLASNPGVCPVRHAAGCSVEGGVCDHTAFGGNSGAGLVLADSILGSAQCNF